MNTTDLSVINFYFINCGNSSFKEPICRVQISNFSRIMSSLAELTLIKNLFYNISLKSFLICLSRFKFIEFYQLSMF
ncbi:conserved hypothetical protein [Leptospira interrogans serovar Manilae]|uniref:Uncharacterized protein n=1 Tax=Leptospira interrogans serovar Manilae TaxID=214675 RepID=A0AAQ1P3Q6_LEPIR|nr:conserved hypothetical protein [Leptospira interrogans serovar Manilae]